MGWKQYAVQAEIDKQIQQAKAEARNEVLRVVEEMVLNTKGVSYVDCDGDEHKILYDDQIDAAHIALGALKTRLEALQPPACERQAESQPIGCESVNEAWLRMVNELRQINLDIWNTEYTPQSQGALNALELLLQNMDKTTEEASG